MASLTTSAGPFPAGPSLHTHPSLWTPGGVSHLTHRKCEAKGTGKDSRIRVRRDILSLDPTTVLRTQRVLLPCSKVFGNGTSLQQKCIVQLCWMPLISGTLLLNSEESAYWHTLLFPQPHLFPFPCRAAGPTLPRLSLLAPIFCGCSCASNSDPESRPVHETSPRSLLGPSLPVPTLALDSNHVKIITATPW